MAGLIAVCAANAIPTKSSAAHNIFGITGASDKPFKVLGWGIYFNGTSSTGEPINVKLQLYNAFTTFGAGTTAVVPRKTNFLNNATVETRYGYNPASAAAGTVTSAGILDLVDVHPQSGYDVRFPLNQEIWGGSASDTLIGIEVGNAGSDINCNIKVIIEE